MVEGKQRKLILTPSEVREEQRMRKVRAHRAKMLRRRQGMRPIKVTPKGPFKIDRDHWLTLNTEQREWLRGVLQLTPILGERKYFHGIRGVH